MNIVFYLVLALHIIACLFLIIVVLLQQGKGQDLASAFGGGGSQTAFGPRGSATILSRATTILAAVFIVTSLALTVVKPRASSVLDQVAPSQASPAPKAESSPASAPASQPAQPAPAPSATTK